MSRGSGQRAVGDGSDGSDEDMHIGAETMRSKRDPFRALQHASLSGRGEEGKHGTEAGPQHEGGSLMLEHDDGDLDTVTVGTLREDPSENEQRPTMLTKRVSWVDGVNDAKSAHIAISIPRHKHIKSQEYVVYVMELWRSGRSWSIRKRYSEFHRFHEMLIEEGLVEAANLPKMPSKRWFSWARLTNKIDEKFIWQRRTQLQEYIRAIVKVDVLVEESRVLHNFLEINRSLAMDPTTSQDSGEGGRNSFYYDIATLMGD